MDCLDLPYTLQTRSSDETFALAAKFAPQVQQGDIIFLQGPLGAGKTQFARGFCSGLGMKTLWEVDSPTYTLVNHYDAGPGIHHIDLYRFRDSAELEEIELAELYEAPSVKLVEWPERLIGSPLLKAHFIVKIAIDGEETRTIHITRIPDMAVA